MENKENLHAGHRQRMIKRYVNSTPDTFEDHELLEMLLFCTNTRKNTNEISHRLLKKFNSLQNVMSAGVEELMEVKGVGLITAVIINVCSEINKRILRITLKGCNMSDCEQAKKYCFDLLRYQIREECHVLYLDESLNLIEEALISEGTRTKTNINCGLIVSKAVRNQCKKVIITHNHPGESVKPSPVDIANISSLSKTLSKVGIRQMDHIIVNENECFSMRQNGYMNG